MEFLDDGDLYQKIVAHQKASTTFDEQTIWKTLIHVTLGLKRLHDFNILHRDLGIVIKSMLQVNPSNRPDAGQLLKMIQTQS